MGVGIHGALLRGAKYLAASQSSDGGFVSQSMSRNAQAMRTYHTTFFPSHILSCIATINIVELDRVKQGLIDFILAQKNEHWSYNYWARTSPEFSSLPYPDDLDDTFCALAALSRANPGLLSGDVLGSITQLLIASEVDEGGPYRTWLVDSAADQVWQDVDVVVNANVGYFLSLHDVELPNITSLIGMAIQRNKLSSPYYPNTFPAAYFISRWYRGDQLPKLIRSIYRRKHDSPLKAALKLSTLMHSGNTSLDPAPILEYLLSTQLSDGSWPADEFCIDPAIDGQKHYASSPSLTTAFCMEALYLYDQAAKATQAQPGQKRTTNNQYTKVVRRVTRDIQKLKGSDLRANTAAMLQEMLAHDTDHQIVLLPYITEKVFGLEVDQDVLLKLAMTNLWGWMAYTIYDDFLDGEGQPRMLPTANVALRKVMTTLATTLPDTQVFQMDVADILNKLDGANAWEVAHCRGKIEHGRLYVDTLPDYGNYWQLAERSLGHTIAGLGVLYAAGSTSEAIRVLKLFFRHYLIARQLNDDAHDWQEDLSRGHVNAAGVRILHAWCAAGGSLEKGIDLKNEAEKLSLIMWQQVIQDVVRDIDMHIARARAALARFSDDAKTELLENLLAPLERAAHHALAERDSAVAFIDTLDAN